MKFLANAACPRYATIKLAVHSFLCTCAKSIFAHQAIRAVAIISRKACFSHVQPADPCTNTRAQRARQIHTRKFQHGNSEYYYDDMNKAERSLIGRLSRRDRTRVRRGLV